MSVPTTEFKTTATDIPGLLIFDVTLVEDARGYFQEKFHKEKLVTAGLPDSFDPVQTNISYNKDVGVTRGYHAEPWDKYISVIKGRVFASYLDMRAGDSFGKVVTVEINPSKAIYLPRGVANSFQTLEQDTYYIYQTNAHWNETAYNQQSFANLNDPSLNVSWPIPLDQAIMSDRDRNHPLFSSIKPIR